MFHAEPNPDAGVHQEWQLCNAEKHLFTLPNLRTVVEWIEDSRLRPDDQISRTGVHWLRLGDIPELSTVFVGFDGLARVFRALDEPPPVPSVGDLGPPPAFGEGLGDIPDFGVGNAPLDSPSQSMPASMLDAVTKAVSAPPKPAADVPMPRRGHRSQPILLSELEAEAKAKAEAAQAAAEAETDAEAEDAAEAEPSGAAEAEGTPTASVPAHSVVASAEGSATADAVEAAAAAQQVASMPPEEKPEEKGGGLGWLAILGVAAGLVVMFGVPDIRAKILGTEAPAGGTPAVSQPAAPQATPAADLSVADQAIAKLGIDETTRAQATLQKMIDVREQRSQPTEDIKLAQVELILTRALAFSIAVSLEPTAVNGTARSRGEQDQRRATELLAGLDVDKVEDKARLGRVQALVALVEGQVGEAANRVPPTDAELALVVKAAPLWINSDGAVPPGLLAGLQGLPQPSGLARSLHALALWRSGDDEGAQRMVAALNQTVPDQPLAITLDHVLAAAIAAESGAEPEETTDAVADSGSTNGGAAKVRRPRPASGGEDTSDPSTLTPRGCEKVRGGDPTAGIKLLLGAIDANAMGFDTYLCLGDGYMKLGNVGSSLSFYDRAVKLAPKNKAALAGAASAAEKAKRTAQAVDFYKRLLAVDPNNEAAKTFLAANGVKAGEGASGGSGGSGASASSGGDAGSAGDSAGGDDGDDKESGGGSPFLPVGG
ncbi:MAG: tetratricopeptide repeat protein [Nannocystaceae bacterium]